MNKKSLHLFAIALLSAIYNAAANLTGICDAILIDDEALFNVCPFDQASYYNMTYDYSDSNYNISMSLVNAQAPSCPGSNNVEVYATVYNLSSMACIELAVADPVITALDSSDEENGLLFTYPINPQNPYNQSLIVQLSCDSSATSANQTNFTVISANSTVITVAGASYYGCPYVSLGMLTSFLQKYKYIFVGIFVILGFFTCFFGTQMMKVTIFIITAVGGTMISGSLFFEFTHLGTEGWTLWLIFAVCIIIGLVLGFIAVKIEIIGFVALGIVLGGVGGLFLYNAVLAPFLKGYKAVLYIVVGVLAIVGGALSFKFWKKIVLAATAVIGSYMMVRSVAVPIGGFPSEDSIAQGISQFSGYTYAYLAAIVVLAIAGGYFQYRRQKKHNYDDDEDPHGYERVMNAAY